MTKLMNKNEREEHLELLAEYGLSEDEDDALTDIMHSHDFDGW
ncbi:MULTISPECIES: hypothetical protein [Metabacillus]|nr:MULTISPECIES: hypothetical protein [Metabacillus]